MESLLVDIVAPESNSNDEVNSKNEEDLEPHKCATCSRTFSAKRDLVTHQYMHRENLKVSCSECNKVFMTESGLRKHMHTHSKKKPPAKGKVVAPKPRKDYTCRQCNAVFATKKQLGLHHSAKHVDEKRFVCEICSSQFAWPENLRAHKQSHEVNPHECNKCGRRFVDATSLRVHTRNSHGPNSLKTEPRKGFSCGICGRAFQFDFSLRAHMKGHAQGPSIAPQDAQQPRYVQMNQEGIVDLQSQNENDTNEIIIEVYNYDTSQTAHGFEDQYSTQEHHNVASKDEENRSTKKNQDWSFDQAQPGLESNNEDTITRDDTTLSESVTSALNPVSIDESGMCITVSAEALPSLLGMDIKKPSSHQLESSEVEESKDSEAQSNVSYTRNTELIWYEPPQTTDDQNAMFVWYQQPQPAPGESSCGWNQENLGSSETQKQDNPVAASDVAKKNVLERDDQRAPMTQVADSHNVHCDVRALPVPPLRGRKSRPREPFLFNCVMTDAKPFVCLYCNEAFRWEISLNVHLRKHNIGHEVASTFLARGGKTRGISRGPMRGRAGVRVKMRSPTKKVSPLKSKSPVGRSRIVPRTASSDEEDEYDEYSFHGEPDEDPVPCKAVAQKRASTVGKKVNGRGRGSGVQVRGFGPRKRGNSSRATSNLQSTNDVAEAINMQNQSILIEPAGVDSNGAGSLCEEHLKTPLCLNNDNPLVSTQPNGLVHDKLQAVSETGLPCLSNLSNPPESPLNSTSKFSHPKFAISSMNRNIVVHSSNMVKTITEAQNVWLKHQRSNLRTYSSCPICKRLLTTLDAVQRHRRSHLLSRSRTIRPRLPACKFCSLLCSSRLDLLLHQRSCGSPEGSRCLVCRRVFTSVQKLDSHRLNHFSKVKPSRCSVCDKRFFDAAKCKIHQSSHVI